MNEALRKLDEFLKGVKTYLTSAAGVLLVGYLESKGIDAVGLVDTLLALLDNATVIAAFCVGLLNMVLRRAMPDKRGAS